MRNKYRIPKFCKILEEAWLKNPDWRFGQLIENIKRQFCIEDLFYIEDDIMEKAITAFFFPERLSAKDLKAIEKSLNCKLIIEAKDEKETTKDD